MAIVKVIEILAQSTESWEDATRQGFLEARKTLRGIQNMYVKEMQAVVEEDERLVYRINLKVSFLVEEKR